MKILQIFLYPFHWKHQILVVFPVYPLPVVPARGGAEVALRLYYKTFFVYRTCIRRGLPARPVCACVLCATVMHCSKGRTHTSHSTLHLISSPLSSSHLISSLLICHLSSSQLLSFHLSTAQPFASHRSSSQPISALLHVRKLLPSERNLLHTKTVPRRKLLHREGLPHRSLRHRCVYRRLQPLYPKKHNGSRSGFLPKTSLMQHSCSHYNAFCNQRFNKRTRLTRELPFIAAPASSKKNMSPPKSPLPKVTTSLSHYFRKSLPVVYCCIVMWFIVVWCIVMWCIVVWCIVMWCNPMWCIVVWCIVVWCIVMWCIVTALRFIRNSENRYPTLLTTSFDNYGILCYGHPLITGTALPRRTKRSEKDTSCIPIPIPLKETYHRGTLWWTNSSQLKMIIEIVDFPINSMVIFHCKLLVHQRVPYGFVWK